MPSEKEDSSKYFVTDPETGRCLELKRYGSMTGVLDLDHTKPIWEQVFGHGRSPSNPEEKTECEASLE